MIQGVSYFNHPLFVRIYTVFGLYLLPTICDFVFISRVSVFDSASVEKYKNKCGIS
jgi:hypothetical protein